ncbi:MAG: VanZ family protein [Nanoarchaeota archaeon]
MGLWIEKKRGISIILLVLLAIEIFFISSISGSKAETKIPFIATAYHFIAFFLFSFFLFFSIKGSKKIRILHVIITPVFAVIYAISDEIHQSFVPLRNSSLSDVLIDSIGIIISIIIAFFMSKKANQGH